ncbi:MAG TPA: amino acid adenylation domain-containing protein, partial [Longimicrobium sp.]|nr:amino acid adenylation domain-containing protein [Longimicrobium sp.]
YGELNARANRLAHHLARLGVGPEARVGLCLERGAELIVAMLAVLKAGGAYLPLDPTAPAERRAFMLADSGASVLVTRDALRGADAEPAGLRVLSLDAAADAVAAEPAENPVDRATPRSLAYVVYTSGSTGTPKGVAVEHGGLANLCAWYAKDLEITAADRGSQLISAGFDASVLEIWPPLAHGARVQVVPDAVRADPDALRDWFLRQGTTLAHCPPPLAGPLLALDWPRTGSPRRMVTGGERLQMAPGPEIPFPLTVGYGATETTVAVTAGRVETAAERLGSIGRPGDNSRAYVLDGAMRPEPVGVAGELCLGGAQVARGYLGRPALTAERFTPDPFGPVPGARLYRTGDRARWRADGTLEFIGRLDGQVKIRGFRVEPGEVEVALRRHPGVSACAVVVREDVPGDRRLAAYVVGGASAPELRAHLRRTLPEHMIPSAFVALEALPQTANDKLDREALPAPDYARADREHVAPRGATEEALASIWAEVLRIDRVGVEDGFFTLGGDSILAIRVATRARKAGMEVTPRALFEHHTIAALAAALAGPSAAEAVADPAVGGAAEPSASRRHTPADFPLASLSETELEAALAGAGEVEDLYPLTPLQEGLLYHSLQGAGHQEYQIQLALRLEGELDGDRFRRAWLRLVDRHAPLRTDFAWRDLARPLQRVHRAVELPWVQEDWSARSDAKQEAALERFLEADHARGFALDEAPLLRFALFRVGDSAHWFAWSLHHLLADGWSTSRIMDEVFRLYSADAGAEAAGLAPVRPYRDFVAWLADQDQNAAERHWRGVLAGFAAPTQLGVDRPPVPGAASRHASRRMALSVEQT